MSKEDVEELVREFAERWILSLPHPTTRSGTEVVADGELMKRWLRSKLTPLVAQSDYSNSICMLCDRCGRRIQPLGRVLEYGKYYPAHTVKSADGTIKEEPSTHEIRKALCVECSKETYTPTPTVKEETPIISYIKGPGSCWCRNKITDPYATHGHEACVASTSPVKEESHTQGWIDEAVDDMFVVGNMRFSGLANDKLTSQSLKFFIKEVASQEYERGVTEGRRVFSEEVLKHEYADRFEAGRLQGIDDVGNWAFENGLTHKECLKLLLTALEGIKNKE